MAKPVAQEFVRTAQILREFRYQHIYNPPSNTTRQALLQYKALVQHFSEEYQRLNPAFKPALFEEAAGIR